MAEDLPPFPVDDGTLNVIRDALDRVVVEVDADGNHTYGGSPFGLHDVLNLLSGCDPTLLVQAVNEYDQPIPDMYDYQGGPIYHMHDLIRALLAEIQRLRAEGGRE